MFDQMFNGNFAGEFSVGVASHVFEQPMPVLIGGQRMRTRHLVVRVRIIELAELLRLEFRLRCARVARHVARAH